MDADPGVNTNINFDAIPDPDPDLHQNDAIPHADPTPSFTHIEKSIFLLLVTALPVHSVYISHQCQRCILKSMLKFFGKIRVYQLYHLHGMDTDSDWQHPDRHGLDADPDPAK